MILTFRIPALTKLIFRNICGGSNSFLTNSVVIFIFLASDCLYWNAAKAATISVPPAPIATQSKSITNHFLSVSPINTANINVGITANINLIYLIFRRSLR